MTLAQLKRISTRTSQRKLELLYPFLIKYMTVYDISTKARISAFIAQVIHESGSFNYFAEIASGKAYEGRKDLGNIQKGDGIKYKGRGLIQITGRSNYEQISKATGIDFLNNPTLLETPENAVMSACWWWNSRNLNVLADAYQFTAITRKINGGENGLKERLFYYKLAQNTL